MADKSTPEAASVTPLSVDTTPPEPLGAPHRIAPDAALEAARGAVSPGTEVVRKASNEWASPRSVGRRGTPPPAPRRVSRTEEELSGLGLSPRPRTPAQVLASRAQAAKASSLSQATTTTMALTSVNGGKTDLDGSDPEHVVEGDSFALDRSSEESGEMVGMEGADSRRESVWSVASDAEDGELRREERVDTSTVDEGSMYNDEEDEDVDHDSVRTSDEYVNIHENDDEDDRDDQHQRHLTTDESLTPDSTPPPTPLLFAQPPPALTNDWVRYVTESGHEYYFNTRTQVSQWTRPETMLSPRGIVATTVEEEEADEEDFAPENQTDTVYTSPAPVHAYVPAVRPSFAAASFLESLFIAVSKNDETAQLQALLRYNIDVNAINASGLTPLHVAIQHGNARGAAMLLDYGALVDGPSHENPAEVIGMYTPAGSTETPLVMACRTNHASLVRLLVRYGASIYTRDGDGNTVLHIAIRSWSDEVLSCLLEIDTMATIINLKNADEETPLHLAARHGNANAVKPLLQRGASTDVEDAQGRTPLVVSIMENRVDCVQLLQNVHWDDPQGYQARKRENEPAMYNSDSKQQELGKKSTEELDNLRVYLIHLLQHTPTDGVLLSTIYQYIEAVQHELAMNSVMQEESRRREENLLTQIDKLTNNESATTNDLAKEREENERLRQQLELKEVEFNSLHGAYESLSSRSMMLESIARSSQDKLRRERAEFVRQEEYWNQTIENSLRENAALLESLHSQQQGWQGHAIDRMPQTNTAYGPGYDAHQHQVYEGSQVQSELTTYGDPSASTAFFDQTYSPNQSYGSAYHDEQEAQSKTLIAASASTTSAKSEPERPVSPERVDAVWSRFFENMSRVSEVNAATSQRGAVLSPNQSVTALLPPAAAVFEVIRKANNDRLRQLLLSGISPNIRDIGEKGTPLHLASEVGDLDAVMLLCEYGADVEIRDENGNTPLLLACSQGHFECTKFLLQSAANHSAVNASRDTALHLAAWDGSFECVEILLDYGVDVLARNSLGLTALANLKTRSPLRHRFDDLAADHPMAKILVMLDEAERMESDDMNDPSSIGSKAVPSKSLPVQPSVPKGGSDSKGKPASNLSWGRWIFGSVFGSESAPTRADDVSDDEDSKSDFEEAQSSPPKLDSSVLRGYEDLRPPPEIAAELRRKPLSPSSEPLPPPPPDVLEALERRKSGTLLSPSHSAVRFASISATKKPQLTTPTTVRSRYVDTFNSP